MSDSYSPDNFGSDQITDTTSQNIFQRLGGALVAAAFGLLLFLIAGGLLLWNESRAVDAVRGLRQADHDVVEASPSPIAPAQNGKLVHLTGALVARGTVSDPVMGLTLDKLVHLKRKVEMFQWQQHEQSRSSSQLGGSQTTQTTYTYSKQWSEDSIDSAGFRGNHVNPSMPIQTQIFTSSEVTIGDRTLTPKLLDELDDYVPITPPATAPDGFQRQGQALYKGDNPDAPAIGDLRIIFADVPAQTVSIMAQQRAASLTPYRTASGYRIGLVVPGDVEADQMVAQKQSDEKLLTWILRGVGFLCFFISLLLVAAPLGTLADVVPIFGTIVGGGIFFFAIGLAIPLTLVTIALSWLVVRPLVAIGLLAAAALAFAVYRRLRPVRVAKPA